MDNMDKSVNAPSRIVVTWHPEIEEARVTAAEITADLKRRQVDYVESYSLNDPVFYSENKDITRTVL